MKDLNERQAKFLVEMHANDDFYYEFICDSIYRVIIERIVENKKYSDEDARNLNHLRKKWIERYEKIR